MIPYGKQHLNQTDIDQVLEVLTSDFLTQGSRVPAFEQAVSHYTGSQYAIALNSATSALHVACLALGVNAHSRVWTSPITFVASANCAKLCGSAIDFVDVDPNTGNLCAEALAVKLHAAQDNNTLPDVVIAVHLAGHSCDMQRLSQLAKQYGFAIIEDASHAIGGRYQDAKIGQCQYSDLCVFSFHPVKIITSAEGGMITTNNAELATKCVTYRSHGIDKGSNQLLRPDEGDWYYEQHELGLNYRMSDIHAALGTSQMTRLDEFVSARNQLATYYQTALENLPVDIITPLANNDSAWHLHMIKLHDASKRRAVFDGMRQAGIQVHVHYFPVHLQPYYLEQGFKPGDCPQAETFYQHILTLPLYPQLTKAQIDFICHTLAECLQ